MKKGDLEFRVGVFVTAALAILAFLLVKAGDFSLKPGYHVRFTFETVNGIEAGSPVRLAGVVVGTVEEVRVTRDPEGETGAEVNARIDGDAFIGADAKPRISALGVLGEKYIEVIPGSPQAQRIEDNGLLEGKEPSNMDEVMNSTQRLVGKIDSVVDNLNEVVSNPEFKKSFKGTFANADQVAKNLLEASEDLKDAAKSARIVLARLRDGEGTVGRLFKDEKIARDLEAFVADIKAHPWKLLKRG